jgi:hypothetical protein
MLISNARKLHHSKRSVESLRLSGTSGSTLVEVMGALLILTVMALGVAAFIFYGRAGVYAQRDRLSVLELVNGRLETLCSAPYSEVTPPNNDFNTYFMRPKALVVGEWDFFASRPNETFAVNSPQRRYPMTTTVRFIDVEEDNNSYDALQFTVSMQYRLGSTDKIELSTYRAP